MTLPYKRTTGENYVFEMFANDEYNAGFQGELASKVEAIDIAKQIEDALSDDTHEIWFVEQEDIHSLLSNADSHEIATTEFLWSFFHLTSLVENSQLVLFIHSSDIDTIDALEGAISKLDNVETAVLYSAFDERKCLLHASDFAKTKIALGSGDLSIRYIGDLSNIDKSPM